MKNSNAPYLRRLFQGDIAPHEARRYVIWKIGIFWALIFLCWVAYPADNNFSIRTHTFSFLGSFEEKHNPKGWWLFTLAMCYWGLAMIPAAAYSRRRFAPFFPISAWIGAGLLVLGGLGMALVGLFPDARGEVFGGWRWTEIHEKVAVLAAISFGLAVPLHGVMVLRTRWRMRRAGQGKAWRPGPFFWPYVFWGVATTIGVAVQIRWAILYEAMKAEAAQTGASIGSSWGEGLKTWYSFPLWENLLIYTLFIFLCWFFLILHHHPIEGHPSQKPEERS